MGKGLQSLISILDGSMTWAAQTVSSHYQSINQSSIHEKSPWEKQSILMYQPPWPRSPPTSTPLKTPFPPFGVYPTCYMALHPASVDQPACDTLINHPSPLWFGVKMWAGFLLPNRAHSITKTFPHHSRIVVGLESLFTGNWYHMLEEWAELPGKDLSIIAM